MLKLNDPRREGYFETPAERSMVHAGKMCRTWDNWGFKSGEEAALARLLLKILRARAAGSKVVASAEFTAKTVARLSAQVDWLIAQTGLNEDRLADELEHDIRCWEPHWFAMHSIGTRHQTRMAIGPKPVGPTSEQVVPSDEGDRCPVTRQQFMAAGSKLLPLLIEWAKWKYGATELPTREQLLRDHRKQFGRIVGISEPIIRDLRRALAPATAKRGGAPTHRTAPRP